MHQRYQKSQRFCLICFDELSAGKSLVDLWLREDVICGKCRSRFHPFNRMADVMGLQVYGLYHYDEMMSTMMHQYKECHDETLSQCFLFPQLKRLRKRYKGCTLVLVPSAIEKTEERGFHAVKTIYSELNLPILDCLGKDSDIKQSTSNPLIRHSIAAHLHLHSEKELIGKDVLLVDDVCTTGSTMKACADLILPYAASIQCLSVSIHPLLAKSKRFL